MLLSLPILINISVYLRGPERLFLMDFNWLAAIGGFFEALYFMLSMMGTVVGVYLLLGSFLNPRPHTSVMFENPGSKALIAIFDGWDNKEAEELRRSFVRIRRLN